MRRMSLKEKGRFFYYFCKSICIVCFNVFFIMNLSDLQNNILLFDIDKSYSYDFGKKIDVNFYIKIKYSYVYVLILDQMYSSNKQKVEILY